MYNHNQQPSFLVVAVSWIVFFIFLWFVWDFTNYVITEKGNKSRIAQQIEAAQQQKAYNDYISKERNLVQCYQDGKVFVTYLAGHIEPNCETIKRGKHDIYTTCNQAITFTIIDSNTNITVGIANCQVTELAPLD